MCRKFSYAIFSLLLLVFPGLSHAVESESCPKLAQSFFAKNKKIIRKASGLAVTGGLATGGYIFRNKPSELKIAAAYSAKNLCTCLYVMNQSEDYCRAYTKQISESLVSMENDLSSKSVTTKLVGKLEMYKASFVDASTGCTLL